jgi:hypothetical protein
MVGNKHTVYLFDDDSKYPVMAIVKSGTPQLELQWSRLTWNVYLEAISLEPDDVDDFAERQLERSEHEANMVV